MLQHLLTSLFTDMSSQRKNLSALIEICQQIRSEEQQVSVALLRARAPMKITVTEAIEAVSAFQTGRSVQKAAPAQPEDRVAQLEKRVSELEAAIADMAARFAVRFPGEESKITYEPAKQEKE